MTNSRVSLIIIIRKGKENPKHQKGNTMNKLMNKLINSDLRILNPSEKTIMVMARIGLVLLAIGVTAMVLALLQM